MAFDLASKCPARTLASTFSPLATRFPTLAAALAFARARAFAFVMTDLPFHVLVFDTTTRFTQCFEQENGPARCGTTTSRSLGLALCWPSRCPNPGLTLDQARPAYSWGEAGNGRSAVIIWLILWTFYRITCQYRISNAPDLLTSRPLPAARN